MKREVIYSLKSRRLCTQLQKRTREKIKQKKNPSFILALSFVQGLSFWDLAASKPRRHCAPENGTKPLSGWEMYVRYLCGGIQRQGSETSELNEILILWAHCSGYINHSTTDTPHHTIFTEADSLHPHSNPTHTGPCDHITSPRRTNPDVQRMPNNLPSFNAHFNFSRSHRKQMQREQTINEG